jgi:hypothetical protein
MLSNTSIAVLPPKKLRARSMLAADEAIETLEAFLERPLGSDTASRHVLLRNIMACRYAGKRKANGNCERTESDGFPAQGVGEWTPQKHERLAAFIDATWAARERYIPAGYPKGGAAYVDIFAGPGLVRANKDEVHRGGPLIALAHKQSAVQSRRVVRPRCREHCSTTGTNRH